MRKLFQFLLGIAVGIFGHHAYVSLYPEHTLLFYEGYLIGIDACKVLDGTNINQPRPLAHSSRKSQK